jgi:hypothetical protein
MKGVMMRERETKRRMTKREADVGRRRAYAYSVRVLGSRGKAGFSTGREISRR